MSARIVNTFHITCDGTTPDKAGPCNSQTMVSAYDERDARVKIKHRGWNYHMAASLYLCPGHHAPLETVVPQEDSPEGETNG